MTKEIDISKVFIEGDTATIMGVKYKRVETPQTLFDVIRNLGYSVDACYEIVDAVEAFQKPKEWHPTPQEPEQVADGLKEAFREAVKQGIIHEVDKVSDVFMNEMVAELKGQTLYDLIADWWDEIFVNGNPSGQNIESLVEQIEREWLPTEHDTNSYKWNECIRTIREKLR